MRSTALALFLGALGARTLTRVEDGQFTREYSRLYTALVLSMALAALALVGTIVVLVLRRD